VEPVDDIIDDIAVSRLIRGNSEVILDMNLQKLDKQSLVKILANHLCRGISGDFTGREGVWHNCKTA
jgi:hypothetical protein